MKYDFKKAKETILEHKDNLRSASLGMHEDWFWTVEEVFSEDEFTVDLETIEKIGGIASSNWATPTLQLEFKDGTDKMIPCHDDTPHTKTQPPFPLGGVLSTPIQNAITPLSKKEEN
jgi:hypothetical protein